MATKKYHLYLDDSGARNPDHAPSEPRKDGYDCFALGGILIEEDQVPRLVEAHSEFCRRWGLTAPLHSTKIRGRRKAFAWLGRDRELEQHFLADLQSLLLGLPVTCVAAVVHRPGYVARYREMYEGRPWLMCKTAYSILIERSAKFADARGGQLEIFFEQAGEKEDAALREYSKSLKAEGMPFHSERSAPYRAFGADDFKRVVLGEPKERTKAWPPIQIADMVLYPIAKAGYDPSYPPYSALLQASLVVDAQLSEDERPILGVKYSCFDETK